MRRSLGRAIQILQYLHEREGEVHTNWSIARELDITCPVFTRVANQLRKQGLITSVQGPTGGYLLGKSATEISFYDVYQCFEGKLSIMGDDEMQTRRWAWQNHMIADMSSQTILSLVS